MVAAMKPYFNHIFSIELNVKTLYRIAVKSFLMFESGEIHVIVEC